MGMVRRYSGLPEKGETSVMKRKILLMLVLGCAAAAVLAVAVRGDAADEMKRLAALMEWKAGTVAADIGAGDGSYSFAGGARGGVGKSVCDGD